MSWLTPNQQGQTRTRPSADSADTADTSEGHRGSRRGPPAHPPHLARPFFSAVTPPPALLTSYQVTPSFPFNSFRPLSKFPRGIPPSAAGAHRRRRTSA